MKNEDFNCPVPFNDSDCVLMAHGGGGRMTHRLISDIFYPAFRNPLLEQDHDGCVFPVQEGRMAYSTDSFVVDPIFFPGGDIGDLAVNGTVNDLACCGARPLYLTAGFILEEGLPLSDLQRIVRSMRKAADKAGVQIVAGDTKVVERGKCDKLFINTSGIGVVPEGIRIAPDRVRPGDVVICSGPIGAHGITILSARESLGFETNLKSDTVSLNNMLSQLLKNIEEVHVLRDPTRGGVSGTLNEIAKAARVEIVLDEASLPIPDAVKGASEILGLDPLYIANEGLVLVILPETRSQEALAVMKSFPEGKNATIIGRITGEDNAIVKMKTPYGNYRIVDMLSGEQLPRIC
ncbi:hydrogenase expression/formation protein HypE [Parabacteroides faecis]|uniref:Hydrogenase expression/formation protein HypE n=1 Tax=Parabacteroides faecis TaxID=1217282 RepID=A0ABR6KNU5_9BACT|nr:hydrogenase expression/formation protein HypE [Parabacteroides faecis]MBB4623191.1 hydrogenase expression/formation protein HypE [Parabacteroides faecis]GGJ99703.1 hydrogenase expression/formation protein HypE [Parabacteroides faecis]